MVKKNGLENNNYVESRKRQLLMREEEHELKVFKELIMESGKMRPKIKSEEIHMGFFVCKLCGYISDNKIKSSQHRERHCNMPVFPYSCSVGNSCKLCKNFMN